MCEHLSASLQPTCKPSNEAFEDSFLCELALKGAREGTLHQAVAGLESNIAAALAFGSFCFRTSASLRSILLPQAGAAPVTCFWFLTFFSLVRLCAIGVDIVGGLVLASSHAKLRYPFLIYPTSG